MTHSGFLQQVQSSPGQERFIDYVYNEYSGNARFPTRQQERQKYYDRHFHRIPESWQLAALVDWLDSEGVYVTVIPAWSIEGQDWFYQVNFDKEQNNVYPDRHSALRAGILKSLGLLPNTGDLSPK